MIFFVMDDSIRRMAQRHVLPPADALGGGVYSIVRTEKFSYGIELPVNVVAEVSL